MRGVSLRGWHVFLSTADGTLYEPGRHMYGPQHVLACGSLATLREMVERSTVKMTEG